MIMNVMNGLSSNRSFLLIIHLFTVNIKILYLITSASSFDHLIQCSFDPSEFF